MRFGCLSIRAPLLARPLPQAEQANSKKWESCDAETPGVSNRTECPGFEVDEAICSRARPVATPIEASEWMHFQMPMPACVEYEMSGEGVREAPDAVYSVTLAWRRDEIEAASREAGELAAASAFQDRKWLETWFATAGRHPDIRAFIASIRDEATGQPAMLLPLVELRQRADIRAFYLGAGEPKPQATFASVAA